MRRVFGKNLFRGGDGDRSTRVRHLVSRVMVAGALVLTGAGSTAFALPVELSRADFVSQTTGLPTIVDDMESYGIANYPDPQLVLDNGTFSASVPTIIKFAGLCGDGDKCLTTQSATAGTFSLLPAGTTFWGTDFYIANDGVSTFNVTVVGGSGTTTFSHVPVGGFWGFSDPLGIFSLQFNPTAGNFYNWSYDNVTTASAPVSTVPEPTSLALLAAGLVGLRLRRRTAVR